MKIEFSGLQAEFLRFEQQYTDIFKRVMRSGRMFQGTETEQFEHEIARYVGRKYAVAVGSCTDALYFALRALGCSGDVAVPDLSFVSSASCIPRAHAMPNFVDVTRNGLLDWEKYDDISEATIYVHLYGRMSSKCLHALDSRQGLFIEDAAQALGAECFGYRAGSLGEISCVSFDPVKNLSSPTGGGMVLTDDQFLADQVRSYRYHGRSSSFRVIGFNSQMTELAAAMLRYKFTFLDEWTNRRRDIAARYSDVLSGEIQVSLPRWPDDEKSHVWHKFLILTRYRDELMSFLADQGISTKVHYPYALHQLPMFGYVRPLFPDSRFKNAIIFAQDGLSLPIHPFLTSTEVEYIVDKVKEFFEVM